MNNYPNNSLQKKETKREVAPVAQGTLRKQSFWSRTAKEFFGNNPEDGMTIVMDQNPDILKTLGGMKKQQFLVGFAAETQNLLENAANKVKKKNLDMIVANDVSLKGAGFNTDTNIVKFLYPDGTVEALEILSKDTVAAILLDRVLEKRKRSADTVK